MNAKEIGLQIPVKLPGTSGFGSFLAKIRGMIEVPIGYEDNGGFHYGVQKIPNRKKAGNGK